MKFCFRSKGKNVKCHTVMRWTRSVLIIYYPAFTFIIAKH